MKTTTEHPTTMKTNIYLLLFLALVLGLNISCENDSLPGPDSATGALKVTIATSGPDQDADGYLLTFDGVIYQVAGVTGSFILQWYEGTYQMELTEVAGNCTVDSDNPQRVTITAGETASVSFNVSCIEALNKQIVFVSDRDGPDGELYLMNPDGSGQTRLTNNSIPEQHPAISPDGTRIAFSALDSQDDTNKIWVMNADGTNPVQLTTGNDLHPHWSPDGTQLTFSRSRDAADDAIYLMDADGTNQTILINTPGRAGRASWSPDGQRVAFVNNLDGDEAIYSINIDGTGQQKLTGDIDGVGPVYSPDGQRIAFTRIRNGLFIYIMNTDGSNLQRVTNNSASLDRSPSWSPDGSRLVFVSGRDGDFDIYVMNTDGSGVVNLTANGAYDVTPHWSSVE